MKILLSTLILILNSIIFSQTTTYSKYEERMIQYANNGWAYATKYDSLEIARTTLDSCWKFIKKYPNTFAKPNVLSYMLEMTAIVNNDLTQINPLIDSVLAYDKLASTVLRIGEILIERNLDVKKGREFVINAFPELSVEFHKYRAYMLLARSDIALGYFSSASENYKSALNIRPNRLSAWYEYLGLARISEQTITTKMIREKIKELENEESNNYVKESTASSNINKKIEDLALLELNGKLVKLKEYIGKVILINRFGFWCGWCIKEFPTLQKIIKEFPEVVFLFINSGDSSEELKEYYFRKKEFGFLKEQTVLWTNKQYFDLIYGRSIPHTLVIDKKSNIRFDYMGYNENLESLLRKNLMKLLNE